jgi:hypothetical protein
MVLTWTLMACLGGAVVLDAGGAVVLDAGAAGEARVATASGLAYSPASKWVALVRHENRPRPAASSPPPPPAASCTASAQYLSRYNDYDLYVHSKQPDQTVTVTAPDGTSKI